jgi:DNA polymerase (family 10)
MKMDKAGVVRVFREMSYLLRAAKANGYKSRAYERAADGLVELRGPLEEVMKQGKLKDIPGIGESLERAIQELMQTGQLRSYERLRSQYSPFVAQLAELPGLGNKRALALWRLLKIESFEALERAIHDGRLKDLRGFGPKTQALLLRGLGSMHEPRPQRYRLVEGLDASRLVLQELRSNSLVQRAELAGKARRFCETIDDVHLLVATARPGQVLDHFSNSGQVFETKVREANSITVQLYRPSLPVRVDVCKPDEFISRWLEATGSPEHVQGLRARALKKQLTFDVQGLHGRSRPCSIPDEAAFYRALGCSYIPPELREGTGEIDVAASSKLPAPLELEDVKGLVHSHSQWSDGNASLEDMASAARDRGYQYMTVTDHSPTAFYAGGVSVDALRRQWDEIDSLNARMPGFRLLKGTESDITAGGTLDYPDNILEQLDVVIGSVHARYQMDEDRMTQRILAAMDSPYLHILGHLTGRLLLSRPAYALRLDEIFTKAARNHIAIEVNGSPFRLDIGAELVRRALKAGVKLVLSADSHSVKEIGNTAYAIGTARKGWATRADVLNTLSAQTFCETLKEMRAVPQ